jgi:hypothetical protein
MSPGGRVDVSGRSVAAGSASGNALGVAESPPTAGATTKQQQPRQQVQTMMSQRERFQRLRQKQQQKEEHQQQQQQQEQQQQHSIASAEKTILSIDVGPPSSMTSPAKEDKHRQHPPSPDPLENTQPGRSTSASTRFATSAKGGGGIGGGGCGGVSSLADRDANEDGRDDVDCPDGDGESRSRQRGDDHRPRSLHPYDPRARIFHQADKLPPESPSRRQEQWQQQQQQTMKQVSLASPKSLLLSVLNGSSIEPLIGDLSLDDRKVDGAEVDRSEVDDDHLSDTSVEDTEDAQGEEQQGREYEYTTSISEERSEYVGELFVIDENAGVVALGGGVGLMLSQEDSATTSKEEGAEAATVYGMAKVVKGDNAIGDRSCKAALVEEDRKEENGPWPADVDMFSPTAWLAPKLPFSNSDKDWFRESWELENNNTLNIVGGDGDKELKEVEELTANDTKSENNVASSRTDGPGRTVVQDEEEEKEEDNLVWSASDNDLGAKKEEGIFGKKANSSIIEKHANHGNKMDASTEKEVEADRMQSTSCSGSFEWDGIGEQENRSGEMDVRSKPKEEKYANETRHDRGIFGIVNSDSSTAYEGFGTVLDSSALSRKESRDESYDDENSNSMGAASEGTNGLATEFDPLSMFGEEEMFDDAVFPGILDATTVFSATGASGFGSVLAEKFPSLISGGTGGMSSSSYSKFPILQQQGNSNAHNGFPIPSPAGSESLESWWQSRHAATQNSDVNSAVQEALTKCIDAGAASSVPAFPPRPDRTGPLLEASRLPNETTTKVALECPSGGSQAMSVKDLKQRQQPRLQNQSPLSQPDEVDSIFSGLIDDDCSLPPNLVKNHRTRTMKARARTPANNKVKESSPTLTIKTGTEEDILRSRVGSNGTEEDIFSGVSVSSQQQLSSHFPRLKESNAIASLLDDGTLESPSIQQPLMCKENTYSKIHIPLPAEPARRTARLPTGAPAITTQLFSPEDKEYGVINLKQIEQSPTNASITSDITSSVIFGYAGDSSRKSSLRRQLSILKTHNEIIVGDTKESSHENNLYEEHDGRGGNGDENSLFYSSGGGQKNEYTNMANRGVSLISFSTEDGASHLGSNALSLQKLLPPLAAAAADQSGNGNSKLQDVENTATASVNDSGGSDERTRTEMVNAKPSFLSQLSSCNIFAASSFVYCAGAKGKKCSKSFSLTSDILPKLCSLNSIPLIFLCQKRKPLMKIWSFGKKTCSRKVVRNQVKED